MFDEDNLNVLLANIVNEESFAHCRLCLAPILDEDYVRFEDNLDLDESNGIFLSLSEIVIPLVKDETIFEEIPGIDAVCHTCAEEAVQATLFIEKCQQSSNILNKILKSVTEKLNGNFEASSNQNIYVHVTAEDSKVTVLRKPMQRKSKKILKCVACNKEFKLVTELKAHNIKYHDIFTCCDCMENFENKQDCLNHNLNKFKCDICNILKCSHFLLNEHIVKGHTSCICHECGKSYRNINQLNDHKNKHHQKQTCPKCGKSYATYNFYLKHVDLCLNNKLEVHPMRSKLAKDYKCKSCNKAYTLPGSLRVHERFAHRGEKGHQCPHCGKIFTAPSSLKLHLITHTRERNFPCNLCQKRFVSKEALLYHTRRHTGDKPYQCTICSKTFVNSSARAEHIKFKHIGPKLPCDICSKKFVSQSYLQQHRSKHFDQSSKLFSGRDSVSASLPEPENIRNYH